MIDPEDVDYKCTLTECSLKKAMTELNEDPTQRLGAVQALRTWVRQQPHYTCRTDTKFLLPVLRQAKFSQLVAREIIDRIMAARTTLPEYMANLDIQDPSTLAFIESGVNVFLPKTDKEGRRIMIVRPGAQDLNDKRFSPVNDVRQALAVGEMFRDADENGSVNGYILVNDYTGVTLKYFQQNSMEHTKKMSRIFQECNPDRLEAFIFYNTGPLFEFMMKMAKKTFFNKKFREILQFHSTLESLYKVIPMELWPDEYLPDDYKGPSAGSIASLSAGLTKRMMDPEVRTRILANTSERYKIDESKRPSGSIPNETFRKMKFD